MLRFFAVLLVVLVSFFTAPSAQACGTSPLGWRMDHSRMPGAGASPDPVGALLTLEERATVFGTEAAADLVYRLASGKLLRPR